MECAFYRFICHQLGLTPKSDAMLTADIQYFFSVRTQIPRRHHLVASRTPGFSQRLNCKCGDDVFSNCRCIGSDLHMWQKDENGHPSIYQNLPIITPLRR
jgi:hypothetical protein